jgi:hypothetical protein
LVSSQIEKSGSCEVVGVPRFRIINDLLEASPKQLPSRSYVVAELAVDLCQAVAGLCIMGVQSKAAFEVADRFVKAVAIHLADSGQAKR